MLSYEKTGSRYEIRGTRGDAEDYYKRGICHIRIFFLCSNKADSTFHQPQAGPPLSPERETCCMLFHVLTMWSQLFIRQTIRPEACGASFQTIRTQNICMLSYALTYKYELALMVGASLGSQVGKNPFRNLESAP